MIFNDLSGAFCTSGRDRTGTPERTGFWIQRVYQFRHRGILFDFQGCKDTNKIIIKQYNMSWISTKC